MAVAKSFVLVPHGLNFFNRTAAAAAAAADSSAFFNSFTTTHAIAVALRRFWRWAF
jgi:hypothetical protein